MAYVLSHSHITAASIPIDGWATAWFTLSSWKGYLQSLPGFQGQRMSVRALGSGDVRLHLVTTWDEPEQLDAWADSEWSAEALLAALDPAAYDVVSDRYEDLS